MFIKETELTTGFASPAQGYEAKSIDLNRLLAANPASTYVMEMVSEDMAAWGLAAGSLLIVDRSLRPRTGSLAVISCGGEFLCRELRALPGQGPVFIGGGSRLPAGDCPVFGVVTAAVRLYDPPC